MTDRETEREIEALRAKGAPANARIVRLLGCRLLIRSDVPLPRERFRIYSGEIVFDAINKGLLWLQKYRARRRQSFRMHRLACRDDLASTSANIQAVRRFQER